MTATNRRRGCAGLRSGLLIGMIAIVSVVLAPLPLAAAGPSVGVQVAENGDRIVLEYAIGQYRDFPVTVNGLEYHEIFLEHEGLLLEGGAPALPLVARSVIIPPNAEMAVRVVGGRYYDVALQVAPSKGNLPRTIDPATVPYEFGPSYGANAFFPGPLAELSEPYILRDYRGVAVRVFPLQYNPVTGILRVYTSLTVEIAPTGQSQPGPLTLGTETHPSRTFQEVYQGHFLNYAGSPRYATLDEEGAMLIICYDQWLPNVQPLVAHKNSVGITTTAVGVSTIPGGNTATAIKNYIQGVYNQGNLAFVLLVGDSTQVATPIGYAGGAVDPTYAKLAGGDNYPDIMVGRFSAETSAHVDTQVQRTVEYENMPATQQAWFWRGVGIGSEYGTGDDGEYDYQHIANIRTVLMAHGYTLIDQLNGPGATAAQVSTAVNAGRGIMNYCGHGSDQAWSTTGFSNTEIATLTNDNMLPFIFSVACVNGNFPGQTCFAEAWMRATHGGEPSGAIACYMSSVNQSWDPPMEGQDEFNELLAFETYHSFGALCFAGSCSMMDAYGSDGVSMYDTWHVFGDPSLRVVGTVAPPHGLKVTPGSGLTSEGPHGGPFTPNSASYIVENQNDTPMQYQVTKTQSWLTITNGAGTLPAHGTITATVTINSAANVLANGLYADTVSFTNMTDHDGDTTRAVSLKVGVPEMAFFWPLDSNPGWSISGGQWAFGHPTGGGGSHGHVDPANGATGTNVYGVNLAGDYSTTVGGPYYLTLGPVDLTDITQTSLKFQRWLNSDYQPYVYATLDVSNNGTTWTSLWNNGSNEISEGAWTQQTYDIAAVADNHSAVYIRWGYQVASGAWAYSGWNIDDVQVWGLVPQSNPYAVGDLNCDTVIDNFDINPFVLALTDSAGYAAAYPTCDINLADINDDGTVDNFDINPFVELLTGD